MELLLKLVHQFGEPRLIWADTNFRAVLPGDSVEKERETFFIKLDFVIYLEQSSAALFELAISTYMVSLRRQCPEIGTISIFWTTRRGTGLLDGNRQRHPSLEKAANICGLSWFRI